MAKATFVWDDENVAHIDRHGLTPEIVEPTFGNPNNRNGVSASSGLPMTFGMSKTTPARFIAVVYETLQVDPWVVRVKTAHDAPGPGGVEAMATDQTIEEMVEEYKTKEDLSPDGSGNGLLIQGMIMELMPVMGQLKSRRASLGLSIAQIARRARLTPESIEGLEGGSNPNPHFDLVWRYALALDVYPRLTLEEVEPEAEELEDRQGE